MAGRGKRGQDLKQQFWQEFRAAADKNGLWCKTKGFQRYLAKLQREYPLEMFKMYLDSMPKDLQQSIDGDIQITWAITSSPTHPDPNSLPPTSKQTVIDSSLKSATDAGAKPSKQLTTYSKIS